MLTRGAGGAWASTAWLEYGYDVARIELDGGVGGGVAGSGSSTASVPPNAVGIPGTRSGASHSRKAAGMTTGNCVTLGHSRDATNQTHCSPRALRKRRLGQLGEVWDGRPTRGGIAMRKSHVFVVAGATALLGVALVATVGDARTPSARPAAAKASPAYVSACAQRRGPKASVGDLNVKLHTACAKGQKPLKLALFPVPGAGTGPVGPQGPPGADGPLGPAGPPGPSTAGEYAVANVFVSRGNAPPSIWATYSAAMGSPIGTTTGGAFRFTCSPAQAPCKLSIAAAVLSNTTGSAVVHARVLIDKEEGGGSDVFCEYADGATNNSTPATISRVPMSTSVTSINTPLEMGIGGSLDCGAGQPYPAGGVVTEISVPGGLNGGNAEYNVYSTFGFR